MLALTGNSRIYLYRAGCDLRKSFDGLCGIIRDHFREDPLCGSLFVFVNKRENMVKLLYWDRDGLAIWFKRLERGRFKIPKGDDARIDRVALISLLEGISAKRVSKRYVVEQ